MNVLGIDIVGWASVIVSVATLTPIVIICLLSHTFWDFGKISPYNAPNELDYTLLFSNVVWQYYGLDLITNLTGEIQNPSKTLPKAMFIVILLIILSFSVPLTSLSMI